jgi:hypothetical protein
MCPSREEIELIAYSNESETLVQSEPHTQGIGVSINDGINSDSMWFQSREALRMHAESILEQMEEVA